jgi:hypothetical protein
MPLSFRRTPMASVKSKNKFILFYLKGATTSANVAFCTSKGLVC